MVRSGQVLVGCGVVMVLCCDGPPPLASISPTVVFTGSGDKRDFFFIYSVVFCPLASIVKKKKC